MVLTEHPYDRLVAALRARGLSVRQCRADAVRASCPAHPDRRPSVTVTRREDRVLLRCFSGCRVSAIVAALGLRMADLFLGPRLRRRAEAIAAYPYCDADGRVIAEKVRLQPKRFRWRTPDAERPGAWRLGLHGAAVGLYRAPELVDARCVVVVEGERAADELAALGFVVTCPPTGASTWLTTWTEVLWRSGAREVVVLPDADTPGRQHAARVALSCYDYRPALPEEPGDGEPWPDVRLLPADADAAPLVVRVVKLPGLRVGEDIVDWLGCGHRPADLNAIVEATPYWSPGSADRARHDHRRALARERKRRQRARDRVQLPAPVAPPSPHEVVLQYARMDGSKASAATGA
jgi:putative DNA primase/helicase